MKNFSPETSPANLSITLKSIASCSEDPNEASAKLRAENNSLYAFFFKLVTAPSFNFTIFCLIIVNTIVLASDDYP